MIRIPTIFGHGTRPAVVYLNEEYESGIVDFRKDGAYHIFTFYNPEDEAAFILRFGTEFSAFADTGSYYCPYIPTGLK